MTSQSGLPIEWKSFTAILTNVQTLGRVLETGVWTFGIIQMPLSKIRRRTKIMFCYVLKSSLLHEPRS